MKRSIDILILTLGMMAFGVNMNAQCETEAKLCDRYFTSEYVSDGQEYRALLHSDQEAEFETTLFGGNTYRMVSCSGEVAGDLIFTLKDTEDKLLFSSADFSNAPYWDFVVENTMEVTINARLDRNRKDSGCAVILIGFKQ